MDRICILSPGQIPITPLFYAHVRLCGGCDGTIAWHICSANFDYHARTTGKLVLNEGKVESDAANS